MKDEATRVTRLLGSDLDGTLLRSGGVIADETVAALRLAEAEGLEVIFVTGRPPRWMFEIPDMTGHRGLALCSNGAVLLDLAAHEIVHADLMDPEIGIEAAARLRSIDPNIAFAVELALPDQGFLIDGNYVPRWETTFVPPTATIDEMFATGQVVKLLARPSAEMSHNADEFLSDADAALKGIVDVTHSDIHDVLVEMSLLGVNKGSGLARYAAERGWDASHVAAVGDMPNDIPMLTWVSRGAAVANAHDDVKAVANEFLPSNDDHGVAVFIERLIRGDV